MLDRLARGGVAVTSLVRDAARVGSHPSVIPAVVDYADPAGLGAALCGVGTLVFVGSDGRADRVLAAAQSGELALPTAGRVAPISRADVAHALAVAAASAAPKPLTTITGPEAFDLDALAALASRLGGRDVRSTTISADEFRHHLIDSGTDPWWSYAFTSMFESIDEGRFAGVPTDFTAITGRAPQPFDDALRRELSR